MELVLKSEEYRNEYGTDGKVKSTVLKSAFFDVVKKGVVVGDASINGDSCYISIHSLGLASPEEAKNFLKGISFPDIKQPTA